MTQTRSRCFTPQELDNLNENLEKEPQARALRDRLLERTPIQLLEANDRELLSFVPPPRAKRSVQIHTGDEIHGCPEHAGGLYFFKDHIDPFEPYTLRCPKGGETYPNEKYPDNPDICAPWEEQGWLDERENIDGKRNEAYGKRYVFNAHYTFWGRWMKLGPWMRELAEAQLFESDEMKRRDHAHRAAVLLLGVAATFPDMHRDDFKSADWVKGFPNVIRIMDYVWEPFHTEDYAVTYDLLREHLLEDASLLDLDLGRTGKAWKDDPTHDLDGDGIVSGADLCTWIEERMLREYAGIYEQIDPNYNNATIFHQSALAVLGLVLQDGKIHEKAKSMMIDHLATNWYLNDGAFKEGSLAGYGHHCQIALRSAYRWLRRMDPNIVSSRVIEGYRLELATACVGKLLPCNDDASDPVSPGGISESSLVRKERNMFSPGYYVYSEIKAFENEHPGQCFAEEIDFLHPDVRNSRFEEFRDLFCTGASKGNFHWKRESVVTRSGYAVLRNASRENPFDLVITGDGYNGPHSHYDMLGGTLYGYDRVLVPEMGYPYQPSGDSRGNWVNHPLSHWTVVVDRKSMNRNLERAQLELFHQDDRVKIVKQSAASAFEDVDTYSRSFVILERGDQAPIIIDRFEVSGGKEHIYSFHSGLRGGMDDLKSSHGHIIDESRFETLLGLLHETPISYGEAPKDMHGRCLAYLKKPHRIDNPDNATLKLSFGDGGLSPLGMDMWLLHNDESEHFLALGGREELSAQQELWCPYLLSQRGDLNSETPLKSAFLTVLETHEGESQIESLSRNDTSLSLELKGGEQYRITWSEHAIDVEHHMADGARWSGRAASTPLGILDEVDLDEREIRFDRDVELTPGDLLVFNNHLGHHTHYRVGEVLDTRRCRLGDAFTDLCLARVELSEATKDGKVPYLAGGASPLDFCMRVACRGAQLYNDRGETLRIKGVDHEYFTLDADIPAIDRFMSESQSFRVIDLVVGDEVHKL